MPQSKVSVESVLSNKIDSPHVILIESILEPPLAWKCHVICSSWAKTVKARVTFSPRRAVLLSAAITVGGTEKETKR